MKRYLMFTILFCVFFASAQFTLKDIYGRNLAGQNITLTDRERYMTNPPIRLTLAPSQGISFPLSVTLSAYHLRLYFDMPSSTGAGSPTKALFFTDTILQDFYLTIFPDCGNGDELYTLTISSIYGMLTYPIQVKDQDGSTSFHTGFQHHPGFHGGYILQLFQQSG